jgi:hypothetical protein
MAGKEIGVAGFAQHSDPYSEILDAFVAQVRSAAVHPVLVVVGHPVLEVADFADGCCC